MRELYVGLAISRFPANSRFFSEFGEIVHFRQNLIKSKNRKKKKKILGKSWEILVEFSEQSGNNIHSISGEL